MKNKFVFIAVLLFTATIGTLAGQWAKSFHFGERNLANSIAQTNDEREPSSPDCKFSRRAGSKSNPDQAQSQRGYRMAAKLRRFEIGRGQSGSTSLRGRLYRRRHIRHLSTRLTGHLGCETLLPLGTIEWQQVFGGSDEDEVNSVQQTLDGGYILYSTTASIGAGKSDVWLVKLLPNGTIEWQKTYGGADYEFARSAQQTADGGYILAGISFSLSQAGIWVAKIQANGMIEWQKAFQQGAISSNFAIQPSSEGGYALADRCQDGVFILKISALGAIEWQKGFKAPQKGGLASVAGLCQTSDNGYVVASHNTYSFHQGIYWLVKVNRQGALVWERAFEGSSDDQAACLRRTCDDCLLLAASNEAFNSTGKTGVYEDMMVMKLTPQGDLNAVCGLAVEVGNETLEPNIQPMDVGFQTNILRQFRALRILRWGLPTPKFMTFARGNSSLVLKTQIPPQEQPSRLRDSPPMIPVPRSPSGPSLPSSDYKFDRWWIGGASNLNNPLIVTMDSHQMVLAFFTTTKWDVGGGMGPGSISGCFIATAAYHSPLHPAVRLLRDFRDKRLLTNGPGRAFVSSYYKWSPAVAQIISRSAPLRFVLRIVLLPIIGAAALILGLGWPAGLAVGAGGSTMAIMKFRRGRRRRKE